MTSSELRMTMQLHKYNRLLQVDLYEVLLNYDLFIIVQLIYHLCGPVFVLAMHVELPTLRVIFTLDKNGITYHKTTLQYQIYALSHHQKKNQPIILLMMLLSLPPCDLICIICHSLFPIYGVHVVCVVQEIEYCCVHLFFEVQ